MLLQDGSMQKLYYAGGFVLLGDKVCSALMEYASALADVRRSDLVTIPAMSDEETRGSARLLIGPASEIFAAPAEDRGVDLDDEETTAAIQRKIDRLRPARPMYFSDDEEGQHNDHHDEFGHYNRRHDD